MPVKWPGFSADHTLVIQVDKSEFGIQPNPLELAGKVFKPKQETHITVFGSSIGSELQKQIVRNPELEQRISEAFEDTDWSYRKTADYRRLVRRCGGQGNAVDATEESIVMLLEMEGMAAFYQKLKAYALIDTNLPVPPPHVTLYTYHCDKGIGVHSQSELEELTFDKLLNPVQSGFLSRQTNG